jgi:hypothetical protein
MRQSPLARSAVAPDMWSFAAFYPLQMTARRRLERFHLTYATHREDACSNCACQMILKTDSPKRCLSGSQPGYQRPQTGGSELGLAT